MHGESSQVTWRTIEELAMFALGNFARQKTMRRKERKAGTLALSKRQTQEEVPFQ